MLQMLRVRVVIWLLAVFFFFLGSMVLVSELKPGPSEQEVMLYMKGMMKTMETSLMGMSMSTEGDPVMAGVLLSTSRLILPGVLIGLFAGLGIRLLRWTKEHGKK